MVEVVGIDGETLVVILCKYVTSPGTMLYSIPATILLLFPHMERTSSTLNLSSSLEPLPSY
jgi:hypothetical protein